MSVGQFSKRNNNTQIFFILFFAFICEFDVKAHFISQIILCTTYAMKEFHYGQFFYFRIVIQKNEGIATYDRVRKVI